MNWTSNRRVAGTRPRSKSLYQRIKLDMRTRRLRELVYELDRGQCVYCGAALSLTIDREHCTLDHVVPIACHAPRTPVEVINRIENLVLACATCNSTFGHTIEKDPRFGRFHSS